MNYRHLTLLIITIIAAVFCRAECPWDADTVLSPVPEDIYPAYTMHPVERPVTSIYAYPELNTRLGFSHPNWSKMWRNTSVLVGCYVGALVVLELLPENATSWNRKEITSVPFYRRWYNHVIKEGPDWDRDNPMFNFILHPYSGAAYFMAARSCGFSFWGSLLYSSCISTVFWEFGIEACMERPSWQDIFITPLVGSVIGEGFFRIKRYIVANDYRLGGSPVFGNIVAFLVDPVNEVVGLFGGNAARRLVRERRLRIESQPAVVTVGCDRGYGMSVTLTL